MDALSLLKDDHDRVKGLLKDLDRAADEAYSRRKVLFDTIRRELMVHELIEEEIFYPALKGHPKARDMVLEGIEEHNVVDRLLGELDRTKVEDEVWKAKATVMMENVEHHIDEEEREMFPAAKRVFEKSELEELGRRMEERRKSAQREVGAAAR